MPGRQSLDKGKAGEREAARTLRELMGWSEVRRSQQYCGDDHDADLAGIPGLSIEVKRNERLEMWKSLLQANNQAKDDEVPLVLHRSNKNPWIFIGYLDNLPKFIEAVNQENERQSHENLDDQV